MISTKHLFYVISPFHIIPHVHIANGTTSPILDKRFVHTSSALSLHDVLYVSKFLVSLLSVSQLQSSITTM